MRIAHHSFMINSAQATQRVITDARDLKDAACIATNRIVKTFNSPRKASDLNRKWYKWKTLHLSTSSVGGDDNAGGHFVFGEGAGLIGTNDGNAAERFDGGQLLDDGTPIRHSHYADRQSYRDNDRQPFGNRRYCQTEIECTFLLLEICFSLTLFNRWTCRQYRMILLLTCAWNVTLSQERFGGEDWIVSLKFDTNFLAITRDKKSCHLAFQYDASAFI